MPVGDQENHVRTMLSEHVNYQHPSICVSPKLSLSEKMEQRGIGDVSHVTERFMVDFYFLGTNEKNNH